MAVMLRLYSTPERHTLLVRTLDAGTKKVPEIPQQVAPQLVINDLALYKLIAHFQGELHTALEHRGYCGAARRA